MTLHRCHRGHHCLTREHNPTTGERHGGPLNAEHGYCDPCARHLEHALAALPRTYTELNTLLARVPQRGGGPAVGGTPDPPTPLHLDIAALQTQLVHETHCWAESTADRLDITLDTQTLHHTRPGHALQRCAHLLAEAVPVLLALRDVEHVIWLDNHLVIRVADGLDGANTLLDAHQRAQHHLGHTRTVHRMPAPCPRCETLALLREDGSDTITCAACCTRYTWTDYQQLCTILARRHEELVA